MFSTKIFSNISMKQNWTNIKPEISKFWSTCDFSCMWWVVSRWQVKGNNRYGGIHVIKTGPTTVQHQAETHVGCVLPLYGVTCQWTEWKTMEWVRSTIVDVYIYRVFRKNVPYVCIIYISSKNWDISSLFISYYRKFCFSSKKFGWISTELWVHSKKLNE